MKSSTMLSASFVAGNNNNTPPGSTGVFIMGNGIGPIGLNNNTLHVNGLWANGLPGPFLTVPGALSAGTLYFGPAGIPGGKVLYIK